MISSTEPVLKEKMPSNSDANPKKDLILVVEDDWEIANFIVSALTKAGFAVVHARDGRAAHQQFGNEIPDLVVLDVMLPGDDGFKILQTIRQRFETPVIMLTALAEMNDKVKGLLAGADDYVTKPFHTPELVARIVAILRRRSREVASKPEAAALRFDGWRVHKRNRTVHDPSGAAILLTSGEFDILWELCRNSGEVLSRDMLVQNIHNRAVEPYDRRVDTLVSRVRGKLRNPEFIKTIRNEGYVFTPLVEEIDP